MSSWNALVEDLVAVNEEELLPEQVVDLWILLGARFGSYAAGTALIALADVHVAVRAAEHLVSSTDEPLTLASRQFLRNLLAHSSDREIDEWAAATRHALAETDPEADAYTLTALRSGLMKVYERPWVIAPTGSGKTQILLQLLAERLSPDDRLTAAAELASFHPDLGRAESGTIRSLLALVAARERLVEELAGEPRHVVPAEDVADSVLRQARIAGEAIASIWEYSMLESSAAAVALGAKPSNRERARSYRERSWLLGLRKGRAYVYPQFQFDPVTNDVYQEVRQANEMLGAVDDPWGVASWWISRSGRLDARPVDLLGTERASEIGHAAQALVEPVG